MQVDGEFSIALGQFRAGFVLSGKVVNSQHSTPVTGTCHFWVFRGCPESPGSYRSSNVHVGSF